MRFYATLGIFSRQLPVRGVAAQLIQRTLSMAYVMALSAPVEGMDRILNVSNRVGPHADCPNDRDDVLAVQQLLQVLARPFAIRHHLAVPTPTGHFDYATGFYIFYSQWRSHAINRGTLIDGAVSPASQAYYGSGASSGPYAITHFNYLAMSADRAAWENILRGYRTQTHSGP